MSTPEDRRALSTSPAGMRFIAMMKIYNDGLMPRLQQYMQDGFSEALLHEQPAPSRTDAWAAWRAQHGRHRVRQVLAASKHQVAVVLEAEHSPAFYYAELVIEEDYPHRVSKWLLAPMTALEE